MLYLIFAEPTILAGDSIVKSVIETNDSVEEVVLNYKTDDSVREVVFSYKTDFVSLAFLIYLKQNIIN